MFWNTNDKNAKRNAKLKYGFTTFIFFVFENLFSVFRIVNLCFADLYFAFLRLE